MEKAKPHYRAYISTFELISSQQAKLVKNGVIWLKSKTSDREVMITGYNYEDNEVQVGGEWCSLRYVFEHYDYADTGLPCGVLYEWV